MISYINNKSKKISEFRSRENITTHQSHTWIPIAQYDSRINSYHNITLNLESITSYCNSYSTTFTSYEIDKINDRLSDYDDLQNVVNEGDISYLIDNSSIASVLVSYMFAYNTDYFEWQKL